MKHADRSLEIVAIGLGQAGGNIAAEFQRRGYRALAFNTAKTDLSSLGVGRIALPDAQRVYIGLEGLDGAGSDAEYGRECIAAHADRIRDAVAAQAEGADVVVDRPSVVTGDADVVVAVAAAETAADELPALVCVPAAELPAELAHPVLAPATFEAPAFELPAVEPAAHDALAHDAHAHDDPHDAPAFEAAPAAPALTPVVARSRFACFTTSCSLCGPNHASTAFV